MDFFCKGFVVFFCHQCQTFRDIADNYNIVNSGAFVLEWYTLGSVFCVC